MNSVNNNQCLIDLNAIASNIKAIRTRLPSNTRIMVIVKAMGYGTGGIRLSQFLAQQGIDILGVAHVEEGIALRKAQILQDIFVLNAAPYEAAHVLEWNLETGVGDVKMIQALAEAASKQKKQIKIHLHIDTGMGRFGCRPENALALAKLIHGCPFVSLEGIFTHFTSADEASEDHFTKQQSSILEKIAKEIESEGITIPWKHAANSSAAIRFHFPYHNMVRIGLAIYGLHLSESTKQAMHLQPALTLTSRISSIMDCKEGDTVSYGRSYKVTKKEMRVAVLPIGYFDGLHRHYSGKHHVIIHGKRCPMIGRICMDFMMVDVTDVPQAEIGDSVLLFGKDAHGNYLAAEDFASSGNTIIHEFITCLGPRIQRVFIEKL